MNFFFKRARRERIRNVFSQIVVNPWNHEMREVVQANKTSGFKSKFDREEKGRNKAREGRGVWLYKLLYRVDNVS